MTVFEKQLAAAAPVCALPQAFPGRFLLPDGSEQICKVTAIDPDGALFIAARPPATGLPIIAYVEEIGRLDGMVAEVTEDGFWVAFSMTGLRRTRLIRHLRWMIRRDQGLAEARRRHTRYEPLDQRAHVLLPGGRETPCEVIDISVSGAALRSCERPALGATVRLGRTQGRVVRHMEDGFAIEFVSVLAREELESAPR